MVMSAPRPCTHPGCGVLVRGSSRCADHVRTQRKAYDDSRGNSNSRGYTSKWRKARAGLLAKHPLCVRCENKSRVVAATVVDHIIPHKGDMALFWDRGKCSPRLWG